MRQKMSHRSILMMGIQVYLMNPIIHWKCAVLMPLPDTLTLQHFLRSNYASAVTIGADADNTALVALYRFAANQYRRRGAHWF